MASEVTGVRLQLMVPARAIPYLRVQKGSIDPALDDLEFPDAYCRHLAAAYRSIVPALAPACRSVLDVGSGLGGIDVLIARHYHGQLDRVALLDGRDDPPVVSLHRRTFNSMRVAYDFLTANGLQWKQLRNFQPTSAPPVDEPPFDLVISQGAWCFHFAPDVYLDFVAAVTGSGSRLIVDVRVAKTEWEGQLARDWLYQGTLLQSRKFSRRMYARR